MGSDCLICPTSEETVYTPRAATFKITQQKHWMWFHSDALSTLFMFFRPTRVSSWFPAPLLSATGIKNHYGVIIVMCMNTQTCAQTHGGFSTHTCACVQMTERKKQWREEKGGGETSHPKHLGRQNMNNLIRPERLIAVIQIYMKVETETFDPENREREWERERCLEGRMKDDNEQS